MHFLIESNSKFDRAKDFCLNKLSQDPDHLFMVIFNTIFQVLKKEVIQGFELYLQPAKFNYRDILHFLDLDVYHWYCVIIFNLAQSLR